MSRSLCKVQLIGNVGSDVEVRTVQGGSKVAQFSLATGKEWKDASGAKQSKTEWHRLVIWNTKFGTLADVAEKYVKKGDKLFVEGEIEYREWTDKEGAKRTTTEIKVRELLMLGSKSGGSESANAPPQRTAKPVASKADTFDDFPLDDGDDEIPF